MNRLFISCCSKCGLKLFPSRYLCPRCGNDSWFEEPAEWGTVSAMTVERDLKGTFGDRMLASIETQAGPTVIAQLEAGCDIGQKVELAIDTDQRILARIPSRI